MESLNRLVSESLVRHGFDRPLDYRRLHWSHWFRCESHHSLLSVPSKPGVFAIAEEIMGLSTPCVETAANPALSLSKERRVAEPQHEPKIVDGQDGVAQVHRMLAVTQFFEDDDMAFVLDRMLSRPNPMRARLESGRYFIRFVVIDDQPQRRSICSALNQWMVSSAEKATGIGSHFATSLEMPPAIEQTYMATIVKPALSVVEAAVPQSETNGCVETDAFVRPASEASGSGWHTSAAGISISRMAPNVNSGADANIHCPSPFPSGF